MKYKVGDKVKVRGWDDMASEFDVNDFGDIELSQKIDFTKEMKKFCGKIVTIQGHDVDGYYEILEDAEHEFYFSNDMFEDEYTHSILIGLDIYNFVKELSDKFLGDNQDMTDGEKAAYSLGKEQILSLLNQSLNEFFSEEDGVTTPTYIVHVPGLKIATDFASIDEIQEQLGEHK